MIHVIDRYLKKKTINFIQSGKIVAQNTKKKYFEGNEVINVLSGKIIER